MGRHNAENENKSRPCIGDLSNCDLERMFIPKSVEIREACDQAEEESLDVFTGPMDSET